MSETKSVVEAESLDKVGGGECTAEQVVILTTQLTEAYESLIDFTSYMFGRISGDPPTQP